MKLLIYGAGVLGSLYAARLHAAGHRVMLLARGQPSILTDDVVGDLIDLNRLVRKEGKVYADN